MITSLGVSGVTVPRRLLRGREVCPSGVYFSSRLSRFRYRGSNLEE